MFFRFRKTETENPKSCHSVFLFKTFRTMALKQWPLIHMLIIESYMAIKKILRPQPFIIYFVKSANLGQQYLV